VVAVAPGDYGKPRPFVVVQADQFAGHPSVTVLLVSSDIKAAPLFRITLDPSPSNGLRTVCQIAVDKVMTLPRAKVARVIGELDADVMTRVTRALAGWLGIAG
jgi:mRNA interferase MazF